MWLKIDFLKQIIQPTNHHKPPRGVDLMEISTNHHNKSLNSDLYLQDISCGHRMLHCLALTRLNLHHLHALDWSTSHHHHTATPLI